MGKKSRTKKERKRELQKAPSFLVEQGPSESASVSARFLSLATDNGAGLLMQAVIIAVAVTATYGHTLDVPFYLDEVTAKALAAKKIKSFCFLGYAEAPAHRNHKHAQMD